MATLIERDPATLSRVERWLAQFPPEVRGEAINLFMAKASIAERQEMGYSWNALWARPAQQLPQGVWNLWFIRAGRGFGKTRTGAEATRKRVNDGKARAVLLIGPTAADARDVMIEQPDSGLLAVHPKATRPIYKPSVRTLEWPNGAIGHVRSAEEPDSIRGPNTDWVWGDEPASWKSGKEAWDNAQLGLRIGEPRSCLTGTPRPLDWLKALEAHPGTVTTTGSTYDNIGNLAPAFIELILGMYEGTRLGAQELHAKYLEDVEGALWRLALIEATRVMRWDQTNPWPALLAFTDLEHRKLLGLGAWEPAKGERRKWETWVAVDPPGETAECGIVVGTAPVHGKYGRDHAVILDDMSLAGPPEVWGPQVVAAVSKWNAVGAVVEKNQGGDMVRSTVHAADPNVKVEKLSAQGSKQDRAEPVSMLYAKGWIHHFGHLPKLESQQTTWVPDEGDSPDRLDALVHLVTKLLPGLPGKTASVHSPLMTRSSVG